MLNILRHTFRAITKPATPLKTTPLYRRLLLLPVLYDLSSSVVQAHALRYLDNTSKQAIDGDEYYDRVQKYNASVTTAKTIVSTRRAEELFAALCLPPRDLAKERVLLIGPRTVQELYLAWLYGFSWGNIEGIDLYQTHPKIHVMNMEDMTHPDASFDAILMANTLAYASDVAKCLSECARVLKPGGHLVFGQTYCPESDYNGNKVSGGSTLKTLCSLGLEVFYYRQAEKTNRLGQHQTAHFFGVRKLDPAKPLFDPLR